MLKNTGSQSVALFAVDSATGKGKPGDAANITLYVTKDFGSVTAIASNSGVPTEMDATNAKGWYKIALSQSETNGNNLLFSGKSSTSGIEVCGMEVFTDPPNYTTAVIDSSGLIDANAVKIGPTGAGTAQTARDLGTSVLLSSGTGTGQLSITSGIASVNATQINSDATSAANLAKTTKVILRGTVQTSGSSTTLIATSAFDVVGTHTDQFRGRIITFDPATTTLGLRGQATDITSSSIATNPVFTVSALTTTPQTGDTFSVT